MHIHELGLQPYLPIWEAMKQFTAERTAETVDQLWLLEHVPVYTQGQAGKPEHLLQSTAIPVIRTDRGGQITYHGPGQLVAYCLLDLKRRNIGIKTLVCKLEQTLIDLLGFYNIAALRRPGAPGIYTDDKKIASIGLRIKNGYTYHGIALNVNMDLSPFQHINPCGYNQLSMTHMRDYLSHIELIEVMKQWMHFFMNHFEP
ncbi:MAG: lipoyl(octanoyl) transferase LipB [Gammaproteobacteria bacterium]|nr:lipoyl(octanoyl) transferase LipB [Gammaproteobacteria bacterium]